MNHDGKLHWRGAGCRVVVSEAKRDGRWSKCGESTAANRVLVFSFLHLGCRSLCNRARGRNFDVRGLQAGPWGASQVASVL